MNDESLEELIRSAAPRQTPDSLRARLATQMSAEANRPGRPQFWHRRLLWPALGTAAAAALAVVFLRSFPATPDSLPQVAVQIDTSSEPVLVQTRTLGRSQSAGNVMVGNIPYQLTKTSEVNVREYADKTLGKIEAYSYSNVSYEAQPLVIR